MKRMNRVSIGGILLSLCGTANAATIYVDHAASGANNGSSWSNAYNSLQDALGAASFGDEIWVTSGTHHPTRQADITDPTLTTSDARDATFWIPRGIKMFGGFAGTESAVDQRPATLSHTLLSGDIGVTGDDTDNSYRVVYYRAVHGGGYGSSDSDQTISARIDGFQIAHANADASTGAGVYAASAAIGTVVYNTKLDIVSSVLSDNSSTGNGGGALLTRWLGTMHSCEIRDNQSDNSGGGAYFSQPRSVSIVDTIFSGNSADGSGGGLCRRGDGPSSPGVFTFFILNSKFVHNTSVGRGGGLSYQSNVNGTSFYPLAMANCEITNNSSSSDGGGLYLWEGAVGIGSMPGSVADVQSSTFADNTAAGSGGAVFEGVATTSSATATLTMSNSILWGNSAAMDNQANSGVVINASCIEGGGFPLPGNITTDPLFYDTAADDYTLQNGSPATDSGWNPLLPPDVVDLDADADTTEQLPVDLRFRPRQINAGVPDTGIGPGAITDMGAYELCPGDFNRDGELNFFDFSAFIAVYSSIDLDADINGDGALDFFDITALLSSYNNGC